MWLLDDSDNFSSPPEWTAPLKVLKSTGPKLVPFFKTVAIFFVLYEGKSVNESFLFCLVKCLPVISLMIFVLLHGMNFSEAYSYSRKILIGLVFSMLGDALLVWQSKGYFVHGLIAFACAHVMYASAFGFRPLKMQRGLVCSVIAGLLYLLLYPGMKNESMEIFGFLYLFLITIMLWRAVARVKFLNDMWTWTKICSFGGAFFFSISDFVIAYDKFMSPVPYATPIIMITYYIAQLGISMSVVDSQVDELLKKKSD